MISATPLAEAAISSEMIYGIPAGLPAGALDDGIVMTPLFNNQLNITFQPDGSVIDPAGDPQGTRNVHLQQPRRTRYSLGNLDHGRFGTSKDLEVQRRCKPLC